MDAQVVLVDHVEPLERRGEVRAADHDVAARLGLQLPDLGGVHLPAAGGKSPQRPVSGSWRCRRRQR
jgi:hypothetical protein